MIEAAAIDRLKQEGLRRGGLTLEDIQRILPLDVMTTEELAAVLMQLEDAGVTVDVDPALLANRDRIVDIHERRSEHAAALDGGGQATAAPRDELSRVESEISAEREAVARREHPPRKGIPVLAVAILVVVAVIVLFLIFGL
jgi:hypothetical protein